MLAVKTKTTSVLAIATQPKAGNKITFTLYGTEGGNNDFIFNEIDNIFNIVKGFTDAAHKLDQKPLEVEILLNLIPKVSYTASGHTVARKEFFAKFNLLCGNRFSEGGSNIPQIQIIDVYFELLHNPAIQITREQHLLFDLKSCGTVADLPKTYALVCNKNRSKRHLQLDTNTNIANYEEFYKETFMTSKDAFFAMAYGEHHISVQNKVVYVTSNSTFVAELKKTYDAFLSNVSTRHSVASKPAKQESNCIFSSIFAPALHESKIAIATTLRNGAIFYSANFGSDTFMETYRITKYIIPAINKSWHSDENPDATACSKELDKLFPITEIDGHNYNLRSIRYLIKVLTGTAMQTCSSDVAALQSIFESVNSPYLYYITQYCLKLPDNLYKEMLSNIPQNTHGEHVRTHINLRRCEQQAANIKKARDAEFASRRRKPDNLKVSELSVAKPEVDATTPTTTTKANIQPTTTAKPTKKPSEAWTFVGRRNYTPKGVAKKPLF